MDSIHGTTVYGAVRYLTLCLCRIIVRYMKYNFDVTRPRYSEYVLPVSRLSSFFGRAYLTARCDCIKTKMYKILQKKKSLLCLLKAPVHVLVVLLKQTCRNFFASSFPTDTRLSSKLEQVQVC